MGRTYSSGIVMERLERRVLLSGAPLAISQTPFDGGMELKIIGTSGNDQILVRKTDAGLVVSNGNWSSTFADAFKGIYVDAGAGNDLVKIDSSVHDNATVFGGLGNDTLYAGSGDDSLYAGGTGKKLMVAGSGDDILVSLGSTSAKLVGGAGIDSFWADNTASEKIVGVTAAENAHGCVHRVSGFMNMSAPSVARKSGKKIAKPASATLLEPVAESGTHYTSFSSNPLFADAGPSANDVQQGDVGDCYFMAVLSSVAKVDPWKIRESIVSLGDGTYAVQFVQNNRDVYVRVDSALATWNDDGSVTYANLGAQGSLWAALMEKAWTYVRTPAHSYDAISAGWMDETYAALGANATSVYSTDSAASLMTLIEHQLQMGRSVTYGTVDAPDGSSLLSDHAYSVDSVTLDSHGNVTALRLRNPWGVDGAGNDGHDDGYISVTPEQAYVALAGVVYAEA